jgi:signal transduction histidine kinase/AraC-like DNA-binding protein/ABC-type sugar transport system substrate-binding protein
MNQKTTINGKKQFGPLRVGVHVFLSDPYWVQVRGSVIRNLSRSGVTVVPIDILENDPALASFNSATLDQEIRVGDHEIRSNNVDVLISNDITDAVAFHLLENGLPIVYLVETPLRHRRLVSVTGLYEAGRMAGEYAVRCTHGRGHVLCFGGLLDLGGDRGISRINGFYDALSAYPNMIVKHAPSYWKYEDAYTVIESHLRQMMGAGGMKLPDVIFSLSDSLALAARDAQRALGIEKRIEIIGVNGDPLALVAIAEGSISATIETSPDDLGRQASAVAIKVGLSERVDIDYRMRPVLITQENVFERGIKKLYEIADMPNQLVGVNRQREQERLLQLETSIAINRRVGMALEPSNLSQEIANLIGKNYGYDQVYLYLWIENQQVFKPYGYQGREPRNPIWQGGILPLQKAGLLGDAIRGDRPVYLSAVSNAEESYADPDQTGMQSRLVLPIHLGESILGAIDLQSQNPILHLRQDLIGLQALADQIGIAMRNAELYSEAIQAKDRAETSDRLKTRLLANVSHELRTPLNIMMGYTQLALKTSNPYQDSIGAEMRRDLGYVIHNGEHLQQMINDLLDLSRADIGALDLSFEVVEPILLLQQTFESFKRGEDEQGAVEWRLEIPDSLPFVYADPVRLRQIIFNLLSNASKFTSVGKITCRAQVEPPYLHLSVHDTGAGIPMHLQEKIFEPFVSFDQENRREKGIGLGLAITRQLIALHGGLLTLDSQPGFGSEFHVYLPLPDISGNTLATARSSVRTSNQMGKDPVILFISSTNEQPAYIKAMAAACHASVIQLTSLGDIDTITEQLHPVGLAWEAGMAESDKALSKEWLLIQKLRANPQYARLPLMMYSRGQAGENQIADQGSSALVSVALKPIQGRSLAEMLAGMTLRNHQPIWVVDDDPEARDLYLRLVNDVFPFATVMTANDGGQALEWINEISSLEQVPGLVILDLMMPVVDGFQVLEALRMKYMTQTVPVLVLSGKMLTSEDVQRLDYQFVSFGPKRIVSADEIQAMLQRIDDKISPLGQPQSALVRQTLSYFMQNYEQDLSRSVIAKTIGVTESYLTSLFRQEVGITPWEFLTRMRISMARDLLRATSKSVTEVAIMVGYNDSAYFSRVFHKQTGVTPKQYRAQLR